MNFAINSKATCCENIVLASWTDGMNKSIILEFALRSNKQYSIIVLSAITPNALIRIKSGMGFLTLGISITI